MSEAARTPTTTEGVLAVRGLQKSYGSVRVLDGIDLTVESDQVLAVLGPSGCGKSTLLRLLAGLEPPDAGTLSFGGRALAGPSPTRPMVAQGATLFPWLSLRRNLAWGPRETGHPDPGQVADELLAATGLDGFADALPGQLSGGMRHRAAIAQVLANRPPVLLLDEPFGALDAQTRLRMHEWLRGLLAERPTTVVLVTHDVDEALLLGDRLALLSARPCRVVELLDTPFGSDRGRATLSDPAFVALKADVLDRVLSS
ncbi:MAG: ABC transporter ATP-binding protein [Actinomycetota bacterium]|nr:ABC transporter ATP-binding protein [Actinomycetota bacterium]